jgi:chemotaxis protein histidine kinase CheA
MTAADEEFARQLARMSVTFVAQLPGQVQALSDDLVAWLSAPREAALLERLRHKVHRLKGAGSTFGCSTVSDAARVLEQRLVVLRSDASGGSASALDEIEAAMEALRGEANRIYGESAQGGQAGMQT